MQDRYVGDVGDFAKFGLLRAVLAGTGRRPGIAWYYVEPGQDRSNGKDGRHIEYLDREDFRECDPVLHDALKGLVASDRRRVSAFDLHALIGPGTVGFGEPLPGRGHPWRSRAAARTTWFEKAEAALHHCDGVFLDPDNGIATPRVRPGGVNACKCAFLDEIAVLAKDRLCVVYHHLCRVGTHDAQIRAWATELARSTRRGPRLVRTLRWRPYSPRAFFILGAPDTNTRVERDIARFMAAGWGRFFEEVPWQGEAVQEGLAAMAAPA